MHVTRVLIQEHVLIKQVLHLMDRSRQALEAGDPVPGLFFEKAVTFCEQFADQFHHFKEEFLLFGMLSYKNRGNWTRPWGCCVTSMNGADRVSPESRPHCRDTKKMTKWPSPGSWKI